MMAAQPEAVELYDGSQLVGKGFVIADRKQALVTAWEGSEEYGLEGFTNGHSIDVRVVDAAGSVIASTVTEGATFGSSFAARLDVDAVQLPSEFVVSTAYPNPFNPTTSVNISVPEAAQLQVAVFNLLGQQVYNEVLNYDAGHHSYIFDAANATGSMASGVYFLQVQYNGQLQMQKLVLMK